MTIWIEMLGILLDNAIESTAPNQQIEIVIDKNNVENIIIVKNTHSYIEKSDIENYFKVGNSSKGNNRGFGLPQLMCLVKECGGGIEFFNEKKPQNYAVFKLTIDL